MSTNFLEIARLRFPHAARIMGSGRYACTRPDGDIVYLCETEAQQRTASMSMESPTFVDLMFPTGCPVIDTCKETSERR